MTNRVLFYDFCHIHEHGGGGPIGCVKREIKTLWADLGTRRLKDRLCGTPHSASPPVLYTYVCTLTQFWGCPGGTKPSSSALLAGHSGCSHLPHEVGSSILYLPLPFPSPPSILHLLML